MDKVFEFLKGYKSILGCIGATATFVAVVCASLSDGFQFADIQTIGAGFSALLLAWGLTGKAIDIQNSLKK